MAENSSIPSSPNVSHSISIKLDQLDRTNYILWLAQFLPFLKSHGLLGFVDGTKPCLAQFSVDKDGKTMSPVNPEYLQWQQQDQAHLSGINATLTPAVLSIVLCPTSRDVWTSLEKRYASQSRSRVTQLKNKLRTMKRENLSISDYKDNMNTIADNLALPETCR